MKWFFIAYGLFSITWISVYAMKYFWRSDAPPLLRRYYLIRQIYFLVVIFTLAATALFRNHLHDMFSTAMLFLLGGYLLLGVVPFFLPWRRQLKNSQGNATTANTLQSTGKTEQKV